MLAPHFLENRSSSYRSPTALSFSNSNSTTSPPPVSSIRIWSLAPSKTSVSLASAPIRTRSRPSSTVVQLIHVLAGVGPKRMRRRLRAAGPALPLTLHVAADRRQLRRDVRDERAAP